MKLTIYDLLKESSVKDITDYIIEIDAIPESDHQETFDNYEKFITDLLGRKPVDTGYIMIGIPYAEGGKTEKEISLYKKDELKEKTDRDSEIGKLTFEDVDALSDEEADRVSVIYAVSKNHAYEYQPWEEILGYEVIKENVDEFGIVPFVGEIVYKMTYFGFDEDEIAEIREAVSISMAELDKVRELSPEEQEKRVFSADRSTAYFSFQDNRPFEEKEKDRIAACKRSIKDKIIEFEAINKYWDEI